MSDEQTAPKKSAEPDDLTQAVDAPMAAHGVNEPDDAVRRRLLLPASRTFA
jgi:hypothetical protein